MPKYLDWSTDGITFFSQCKVWWFNFNSIWFSKQTNNNTLYRRCTQLGNFARPNYVMKYSNRDLLAKVTKNLAINIRFVVIKG